MDTGLLASPLLEFPRGNVRRGLGDKAPDDGWNASIAEATHPRGHPPELGMKRHRTIMRRQTMTDIKQVIEDEGFGTAR